MCNETPEFEVRIKGHSLVKVIHGGVRIDGHDFHSDLKNLSSLVNILNDVLETTQDIKKPRLVSNETMPSSAVGHAPLPSTVISGNN